MTDLQFETAMCKIRSGDKQGLQEIYEEYIGLIYAIVKDVLKNKENAEDVTSDFFIRLWDKADTFQSGRGHKTWITTIVRNMAIDYLRKYRKEEVREFLEEPDTEDVLKAGAAPDSPVEREVLSDMTITEALSGLKENEKQIMNMKILGDMTFQEIAGTLRISIGTVTWRYQNAVKKLRRCGYGTGF